MADPAPPDQNDADGEPETMPVLHLDGFDGPMDLLLDLALRQRVDFGRMSIRALAEQFAAAMQRVAGRVAMERRADWLVLAARLVLLRARLIAPADPAAAAAALRDAAAELRRLDEIIRMRAAAEWLAARPALGRDVFTRPHRRDPRTESWMALMEACLVLLRAGLRTGPGRHAGHAAASDTAGRVMLADAWRASDALAHVRALLALHPRGGDLAEFLPALPPDAADRALRARVAVASTLLAGLELARDGAARLRQDTPFGAIELSADPAAPDRGTADGTIEDTDQSQHDPVFD